MLVCIHNLYRYRRSLMIVILGSDIADPHRSYEIVVCLRYEQGKVNLRIELERVREILSFLNAYIEFISLFSY